MFFPGDVYRPTLVSLFWGRFSSSHLYTGFSIQVVIAHAQYPLLPISPISSHGPLGACYTFFFAIITSVNLCLFMALLYLSLDGVIPEAFIYVYIPYNISYVSSVGRTGDKVN